MKKKSTIPFIRYNVNLQRNQVSKQHDSKNFKKTIRKREEKRKLNKTRIKSVREKS